MFNILIRTSNRPEQFKKCIDSIFSQRYKNFNIICCYDDKDCYNYLSTFNDNRLKYYYINLNISHHYKYNLYCNYLLEKVNSGWIIFLDDDDMFNDDTFLENIVQYTNNKNNLIMWKVLIDTKEVYPKKYNDIKFGEINTSSFCFHSKYKNYSEWKLKRGSDFTFITTLQNNVRFNTIFINKVYVKTQIKPSRGKKVTCKTLSNFNIKSVCLFNDNLKKFFTNYKNYSIHSTESCLFVGISSKHIIDKINNYKGYCYILIKDIREFYFLKYINKETNIKFLILNNIKQSVYISYMHIMKSYIHYDIIKIE